MTQTDTSHLIALIAGRAREAQRLADAKSDNERALRTVWLAQTDKEIAAEERFLGLEAHVGNRPSVDELVAELGELGAFLGLETAQ